MGLRLGDYRRYKDTGAAAGCAEVEDRLVVYGRMIDSFRDRPEEIQRLIGLERDPGVRIQLRYMTDRVAFARELLKFDPEPLQEVVLRSASRRLILNCNRQWGKSTVAAIRALHRAWFWPGSLILVLSRAQPQAGELLQKIRDFVPGLGIEGRLRGDGINRMSLKLPNGSRIVALPGGEKPTRSYSKVSMVIIDEAAMVADPVHDAVSPTLATTNGDLLLLSTPRGKRGAFYRAWEFGGADWERVFGPVDDASARGRISREFLELERRLRGEDYYAQEYLCQFLDRDSHLFNEDSLREVFSKDLESWEERKRR